MDTPVSQCQFNLLDNNNLFLNQNNITFIDPYALAKQTLLEQLHLEFNRLSTIDNKLFKNLLWE